jgi:multidrug efflux pump subunit AcrB
LLDDTVVVVENIQRHYENLSQDMSNAVYKGTSEIMFADFSGTITTMIALVPILFVGDYPQTIFGPLIGTLLLALAASYIVSITFVPLISKQILAIDYKWIVSIEKKFKKISDFINTITVNFFLKSFQKALKSKKVLLTYVITLLALFVVSIKIVMPLVGQELMPAMDTGGVKIKVSTTPNISIHQSKKILEEIEQIANSVQEVETISASIGSEAGVLSLGSGGGINDILIIVNYINRFEREQSIWEIQEQLKEKISKIKGIKTLEISDAGATAMASIKANIDVTLYGDDFETLYTQALKYEDAMKNTKGIVTATKSWHMDTMVYTLNINTQKALEYGISNAYLINALQPVLKGFVVSSYNKNNETPLGIRVLVKNSHINTAQKIENILIHTPKISLPLSAIATIETQKQPNIITRENLHYTIDIFGFREKQSLSYVMANFENASKHIVLPKNITMKHSGDIEQLQDSSMRIIRSVAIGLVLIFLVMIPMFESLKIPLVIIFSIPLTLIGASWILLLLDYHSSMSAMIGFILLAGVIVNNAILLIHFALEALKNNKSATEAMIESIQVRTRPVLMTSISVSVGMIPVAFGWAIGMERLAPLGAVVIGGLLVGTFLTLLFIPLLFVWISKKEANKPPRDILTNTF